MFELTKIDRDLAENVSIFFVEEPSPVSLRKLKNPFKFTTASTNAVATIDKSGFPTGPGRLLLQFPPKIISDGKSADWKEEPRASYEPLVIWQGASARRITIELTYIIDGGIFNAAMVALLTKKIKGYFYRDIQSTGGIIQIPLLMLQFYDHVGKKQAAAFRMLDVGITHGDTIIRDAGNFRVGAPNSASGLPIKVSGEQFLGTFPLLTKITMNCALVTRVGNQQLEKNPFLIRDPIQDWY